ncbi:hypothetical protein WA171_005334 [Blastocystis sp. BT1]
MAENGFTNLGENFDNKRPDTESEPVDEGQTQKAAIHTDENGITYVDGLCMNCGQQGHNRLMMTRIPNFREIIIVAFECPHCGFKNNEVQSGATIQERGVRYQLTVSDKIDLNRQIIKGDNCTISIPEVQLDIPDNTQRGDLNTVEGVISRVADQLRQEQPYRKENCPEVYEQIEAFCKRLDNLSSGVELPFTMIVDDPSGNSFVENPYLPKKDPHCRVFHYYRTKEQHLALGMALPDDDSTIHWGEEGNLEEELEEKEKEGGQLHIESKYQHFDSSAVEADKELMVMPAPCHACGHMGESKMCVTDIPYFKEVIIMSFVCDFCGFRTNEIKAGGSIPKQGQRLILRTDSEHLGEDLRRDLLKSDTATVYIPEINLELESGTLGGLYSTVEGLLTQIIDGMNDGNPLFLGDSAVEKKKEEYDEFMNTLKSMRDGKTPFTLDIVDPLANSWIYSDCAPNPDPRLEIVDYTRSFEEDEALGLNDMVVDDEEIAKNNMNELKQKLEEEAKKVVEEEERVVEEKKEKMVEIEKAAEAMKEPATI